MKATRTRLEPVPGHLMASTSFAQHVRTVVVHQGEQILAEIPRTLRRLGTLFLVLSITIPAFFVGVIILLWLIAR